MSTERTDLAADERAALVDRLAGYEKLEHIPRSELEWVVRHGSLTCYEAGEVVAHPNTPIHYMWICLSGGIAIDVDRGAGPRRAMEWGPGDVSGMLPYSRMLANPGLAYALERTEALRLEVVQFPELLRECPAFVAHTVHIMLDRARSFNTSDLHDEKMVSLGRLAAGLAHELNNPASAAARAAQSLGSGIVEADSAARRLGGAGLDDRQMAEVERVRDICMANPVGPNLSAIDRANREDEFAAWLERHDIDPDHAAPLAETPVSLENLDLLGSVVPGSALAAVVEWIAAGCSARALSFDIERATHRIHDLVSAVKRFSYMDRTSTPELVGLEGGLRDTLTVLRSKARGKSVEITMEIEPDLPGVMATGGELNQVWLNLVDNALDAVPEGGHIQLLARRELEWVAVRVVDDGPGVPADLVGKIFDPFFTTKPPGDGTGLGLDIARHLVKQHGGEIEVHTRPGRTEFLVRLPVGNAA
jgi:signal transduction histidine kinase